MSATTTTTATAATPATATTPTTAVEKKIEVAAAPAVRTLAGKVAIVTGGGRGIGAATSTHLARDGAKVIVNYVSSASDAQAVVDAIKSAGGDATAVQADVATIAGADRLFAEAKRIYGKVDILIANAGVAAISPFAEITEEFYDRLFNTNVKGVAFLYKNAALHLEAEGRVIGIGSGVHRGSWQNNGIYAATKAALAALGAALATEVASKKITVNTIHAGATETELFRSFSDAHPGVSAHLIAQTPLARLGTPSDIASAVSLLVSEQARWITGQGLLVTGGLKD